MHSMKYYLSGAVASVLLVSNLFGTQSERDDYLANLSTAKKDYLIWQNQYSQQVDLNDVKSFPVWHRPGKQPTSESKKLQQEAWSLAHNDLPSVLTNYSYNGRRINVKEVDFFGKKSKRLFGTFCSELICLTPAIKDRLGSLTIPSQTVFRVWDTTSSKAIYRLRKDFGIEPSEVVVLDFANASHKAGGFFGGANAQEEAMCREGTLLAALISKNASDKFYNRNNKDNLFGADKFVLVPNVAFFKTPNEQGGFEDPVVVSVYASAAPNRKIGSDTYVNIDDKKAAELITNQIRSCVLTSAIIGKKALVLGAYGCGAFKNNAQMVVRCFEQVLIKEGLGKYFKAIVFPVLTKGKEGPTNFNVFSKAGSFNMTVDNNNGGNNNGGNINGGNINGGNGNDEDPSVDDEKFMIQYIDKKEQAGESVDPKYLHMKYGWTDSLTNFFRNRSRRRL